MARQFWPLQSLTIVFESLQSDIHQIQFSYFEDLFQCVLCDVHILQ